MTDGAIVPAGPEPEGSAETALVEIAPGVIVAFGAVPEHLELLPFTLMLSDDRTVMTDAIIKASPILNMGGQIVNGVAQAQGLVRLAPETLSAMRDGAVAVKSGGYNIGVLAKGGKFATQVRWLPATGAQAAGIAASMGSAAAMIAIQMQLNEISGLVRQNLAITETALKTVRNAQWAELDGLERAVSRSLAEANAIGHVPSSLWENVAGSEAALLEQRDLFRRHVTTHAAELAKRQDHDERRQFLEANGEAMLADAYGLLVAHKAWFQYQALRAGRARVRADVDPHEARLLELIVDNVRREHDLVVTSTSQLLDTLDRELWMLAELPGRRTLPFSKKGRNAREVSALATQVRAGVEQLQDSIRPRPETPLAPDIVHVADLDLLAKDVEILARNLGSDEVLQAVVTAKEAGHGDVLIALTDERVLLAGVTDFRQLGVVGRSIGNEDVRFVRFRVAGESGRAEIDLITSGENLRWRFPRESANSQALKSFVGLLSMRMSIPVAERQSLLAGLSAPAGDPQTGESRADQLVQ